MLLADKEIETFFHSFHGEIAAPPPSKWLPELVCARLVESARVVAAITERVGHRQLRGCWPDYTHSFEDLSGRSDEHRAAVWTDWARSRPQYDAETVSRAQESQGWVIKYLSGRDGWSRVLIAIAAAKAAGVPIVKVCRKRGWSEATIRRTRHKALAAIADGLNRDRIVVREARVLGFGRI